MLSQKSRNGTGGNVGSGIDSIYYFFPSIPLPHILGKERGTKTLFFLHTHIGQTWIQGERKGGRKSDPSHTCTKKLTVGSYGMQKQVKKKNSTASVTFMSLAERRVKGEKIKLSIHAECLQYLIISSMNF